MYQLKGIGKVHNDGTMAKIILEEEYKKALKYLNEFSHIHIFYTYFDSGIWTLNTRIAEIQSVEMEIGSVLLKNWNLDETELNLIDIKPYFPCEDSVKASSERKLVSDKSIGIQKSDTQDIYEISQIGMIRNTHGEIYIQLNEMIEFEGSYVKVLWWFDKFDSKKYRKLTECNPPYENAPRTGIFATRSPVRPNPLAMTVARVMKLDKVQKRIYINSIESFDKTPCIGIMDYSKDMDLILDAKVPKWLSHWPKWYEDRDSVSTTGEITCKESALISLLNENRIKNGETQITSGEQTITDKVEDGIWIKGARENNLKGVNVKIPYRKITAVVGVSGSGKSSLVKDTIYTECRRRMEFLNNDQNTLQKPDVEYMTGCIPSVIISQSEIRGNSQSTIGTYTNAYDYLRIIYAGIGVRHCPECGNEIIPLSREAIIAILSSKDEVYIYDLNKQMIVGNTLEQKVDIALERGCGAFYITVGNGDYILMQTKQKCYHCDKLMFELIPTTFSYLDPESRCPICNGTGKVAEINEKNVIENPELSLLDGASSFYGNLREFISNPNANWMKGQVFGLADKMKVDLEKPWNELTEEFRSKIMYGTDQEIVTFVYQNKKNGRKGEILRPVEGVYQIIKRLYDENGDVKPLQKYMTRATCNFCNGERLNKEGRMVTIGQVRYSEAAAMSFDEIIQFCEKLSTMLGKSEYEKVKSSITRLNELAKVANNLGIGYLQMDRGTSTLSGGEGQRLKLLAAMQSHMTGLLYVFDEPSRGLHPKDYTKVANMIKGLKREGNTIIMVEHNEDMIRIADNIIEIGPGAGEQGGYLVGEGTLEAMINHKGTQLSQYLNTQTVKRQIYKKRECSSLKYISMDGLCFNNLKNISIKFPKKALTCICGVSGSGKSSLMKGEIYSRLKVGREFSDVVLADRIPIGRTSKSVLATYIGIMDSIREVMASTEQAIESGYDEKFFSFNGETGQCEACKGEGRIKLKYLDDSYILCPDCNGKRYKREVLKIQYKGKNIDDILCMSVVEALDFWNDKDDLVKKLLIVREVGMGYLKIGQNTTTFSGGEASRLKLAKELMGAKNKNVLYLLDEPTTGLHFSDIDNILKLIQKLIDEGNTVVAIEHDKQFTNNCDWIIELGPGAGANGGEVLRQDMVFS